MARTEPTPKRKATPATPTTATGAPATGERRNPFRRPEDVKAKQGDAVADVAGHLNAALEAGHRQLGVQAGIAEAVAQRLRAAGWTAVVMPVQAQSGAQVNVLVACGDDPASWQAFVAKAASLASSAPVFAAANGTPPNKQSNGAMKPAAIPE